MQRSIVLGVLVVGALTHATSALAQTPAPTQGPAAGAPAADARAAVEPAAVRQPPVRPVALRFTLSPEWGYRSFRDHEPSATDKRYTASGVPGASARLEVYPLAFVSPAPETWKDLGVTGGYFRAFGLSSRDVDTDTTVDTQWYQVAFGLRYRILGETNPLAIGFTAGVQTWVFDFDNKPSSRTVAVGRYTLLPMGADVRYAWGDFSLFGDARFLLPIAVTAPGDRSPSGGKFGLDLALAAAMRFAGMFELEARATYTMVGYSLSNPLPNVPQDSSVLDEYLVLSLGASFVY